MKRDLETMSIDCVGDIREIRSSLIILQNAIQNEFADTENIDIDRHLRILLEKIDKTLDKSENLHEAICFSPEE